MQAQCRVWSASLRGVEAILVSVEVFVSSGMPGFTIVGMPDAAIQEARERVRAAIKASGFKMPMDKVVVNLAPGSLKKSGSGFDLPIALGILAATGQMDPCRVEGKLCVGELSLEGKLRTVMGMLAYELCARDAGLSLLCAQPDDGLVSVEGLECCIAPNLTRCVNGNFTEPLMRGKSQPANMKDFADVCGHDSAKRALQIAAAGGHGVLMMGSPGSGKTMLSSRIPTILPPLSEDELTETAVVHSVAGEDISRILAGERPFRSPHHSASIAGLVGGGSPMRPGEISLATGGVLFLDELAEFKPSVLQALRQPIESGRMVVTRAEGSFVFPARFMLVAASNPCPCGYCADKEVPCTCSATQIRSYQSRIGGPLMDRIDIHIDVWRTPPERMFDVKCGISSSQLREGVMRARAFANERKLHSSAEGLIEECDMSSEDEAFLKEMAVYHQMSGRGLMKTLSIARTIADMSGSARVITEHLCEAVNLRVREGIGSM